MTLQTSELTTNDNAPPIVFVVDDNYSVREAISELLNSVGIVVKKFPSAQDILEELDDCNNDGFADANCFILNVRMPGMAACTSTSTA